MSLEARSPRRVSPIARILIAMALGILLGCLLRLESPTRRSTHAAELEAIGRVVIDMVKALAAPLLLFAVLDAFLRTEIRARAGATMVAIALTNAAIALGIGLTLSNVLKPGSSFHIETSAADSKSLAEFQKRAQSIDFLKEITGYLPTNVVRPFVDNAIITIVILAVLVGAALRRAKTEQIALGRDDYLVVEGLVSTMLRAVEIVLGWVMVLIPLAVFAAVSTAIGRHGFGVFRGLAAYVGAASLGLALQVFVVYQAWIVLVARKPLGWFWKGARAPLAVAMGTASSMATLPETLKALRKMDVSPQSANLAACVGTNLNNDGILLYEAMAVLFVAQAYGVPFPIDKQLVAVAACAIAGMGISGIPDAGFLSLTIVLATVDLPVTILPVLLTVDWLIGRMRAMTNVTSDMLVAVLLDRLAPSKRRPDELPG